MRLFGKLLALIGLAGLMSHKPAPVSAKPQVTAPSYHRVLGQSYSHKKATLTRKEWRKRRKAREQQEQSRRINRK